VQAANLIRRCGGFTLLEVMVVIVIIGVIVTITTISVGVLGRDREIEDQARRFAAILSQAKEEAELQGREVGVFVDTTGYEFFMFDARQQTWRPVSDDAFLAERRLPEDIVVRLWMEGREVVLKPHAERTPEKDHVEGQEQRGSTATSSGPTPQITLLSSGEVNNFELHIQREGTDHIWRVVSNTDNTLLAEEFYEVPPL
jgi:general secretion pathway protein H